MKSLLHIWWCARLPIHSSFQTVKLDNRVQRTNKKIHFFDNDQYSRKKYFSTVVLPFDERIFIDILKNQPPNVNSYRNWSASNLLKSRVAVSVKENTI